MPRKFKRREREELRLDKKPDCIEWEGSLTYAGYGQRTIKRKVWLCHRLVFLEHNGYLPDVVRHTCDFPPCINPAHLLGGTQVDNIRDTLTRNRHTPRGKATKPHPSILTDADISYIRDSKERNVDLADKFGLHPSYICQIKKRKRLSVR